MTGYSESVEWLCEIFGVKHSVEVGFGEYEYRREYSPEQNLLVSLLYNTCVELGSVKTCRHERHNINLWISDREIYPWSFGWVCLQLDVEPDVVESSIRKGNFLHDRNKEKFWNPHR